MNLFGFTKLGRVMMLLMAVGFAAGAMAQTWTVGSGRDAVTVTLSGGTLTLSAVDARGGSISVGTMPWSGSASQITKVVVGSGVGINYNVFSDCANLTSFDVDAGNTNYTSVDGVLFSTYTGINIYPRGKSGTSYVIPDGTPMISHAFHNCTKLTSITIPSSVTNIVDNAFMGCTGLTSITCLNPTPPFQESGESFKGITTACLYVPQSSVSAYKAATGWKEFSCINAIGGTTPPVTTAYTITFNANSGSVTPSSDKTDTDGKLSSFPEPTRSGYTFAGWFTSSTGGAQVDESTVFTKNTTVYAHWTAVTPAVITISFEDNTGTISAIPAPKTTGTNGKLSSLPAVSATRTGYTFDGWYTEDVGGVKVSTGTVFGEDATLYARWKPVEYTITYTLNSGTVSPPNPTKYTIETETFALNNPTRPAYKFDGWTGTGLTTEQEEVYIEQGSIGNKSFTAKWTAELYEITFDPQGGECKTESAKTAAGGKLTSLPTATMDDYAFEGWFTEYDGGTKITTSYVFTEDTYVYAQWTPVYTITFNPMGGTVTPATAKTGAGGKLASLPTPTKPDSLLAGWYTTEKGGGRVTASTVFDDDATIYARWSWNDPTDAVLSFDRDVPRVNPGDGVTAIVAPVSVLSGEFAAGPNPADRSFGSVSFYRVGSRVSYATLTIYDAAGNAVKKIRVIDDAVGSQSRRKVSSWNLRDSRGRAVSAGTYLVKGVIKASGGKIERVSAVVGVR